MSETKSPLVATTVEVVDLSNSKDDQESARRAMGLLLPRRVASRFAEYIEKVAVVARGDGDIERPFEQLMGVVESTGADGQLHELLYGKRGAFRILARSAVVRTLVANKVEATFNRLATSGADSVVKNYLGNFDPPVLFLAAGGMWQKPQALLASLVQGTALLRQTKLNGGEARFFALKRFANLVLIDLMPKYTSVLGYLEAARTHKAVVGEGKGDNLGALVRGLRESLPNGVVDLVPQEIHKIRNAVSHGRFDYDYARNEVSLTDRHWRETNTMSTLVGKLEAVFENQVELLGRLSAFGGAHVTRQMYENVDFEQLRQGRFDASLFAYELMKDPIERGAAWFDVSSSNWRDALEKFGRKSQVIVSSPDSKSI